MTTRSLKGKKILALSGGVGGAKLALGLAKVLAPSELVIVTNTGDDFRHLGLHIAPDLDTVMYTLADLNNKQQGWGLAGETWNFMAALAELKGEIWFQLGDRDLATHVERTRLLAEGKTLSQVTQALSEKLGLKQRLLPMSDDGVATKVLSVDGELAFQHYFVREQCNRWSAVFALKVLKRRGQVRGFYR